LIKSIPKLVFSASWNGKSNCSVSYIYSDLNRSFRKTKVKLRTEEKFRAFLFLFDSFKLIRKRNINRKLRKVKEARKRPASQIVKESLRINK